MNIIETKVFTFDELSDNAKEKARDWFRTDWPDYEWWDTTYAEAVSIGALLGFSGMKIQFSGFWSQGDGASFKGEWRPPKVPVKAIRKLGWTGKPGEALAEMARDAWIASMSLTKIERDELPLTISTGYREVHEMTMQCDNERVLEIARDFARWIYRQLEAEWEYMNSDEQVDEMINANEYTFTEEGRRFG